MNGRRVEIRRREAERRFRRDLGRQLSFVRLVAQSHSYTLDRHEGQIRALNGEPR